MSPAEPVLPLLGSPVEERDQSQSVGMLMGQNSQPVQMVGCSQQSGCYEKAISKVTWEIHQVSRPHLHLTY